MQLNISLDLTEPITVIKNPVGNATVFVNWNKDYYDLPIPNEHMRHSMTFEVAAGFNGANNWKRAAKAWLYSNWSIPENEIVFVGSD